MLTTEQKNKAADEVLEYFAAGDFTLSDALLELKWLGIERNEALLMLEAFDPKNSYFVQEEIDMDISPRDQAKLDNYNFNHDSTL